MQDKLTALGRFIPTSETNSPVQIIKIIIHQYIGVAGFLISIFYPYQKFLPLFFFFIPDLSVNSFGNAEIIGTLGAVSGVNLFKHGALGLAGIFDCHAQL